jgi:hypothetical protein
MKKVFEVVTDVSDPQAEMTVQKWAAEKLLELQEENESQLILPTTSKARTHPFLIRSGWINFFQSIEGSDFKALQKTTDLSSPENPIRILLQKVFGELHESLKAPSHRELRIHLFSATGCVARDSRSVSS